MVVTDDCPSPDELAAFYDGGLPTDVHLRTAAHLRRCTACRAASAVAGRPLPEAFTFPDPVPPPPDEPRPTPPPVLDTIGPYRVRRLIGRGGMGAVYEAVHERLGKAVALKVLPRLAAADPEYQTRFEREVRAVGKLDHPNVVRATDAGDADGVPFLAMELVDGVDLTKLLRVHRKLAVGDAAEVARQAADALAHAHARGIVHRDVKPSNLMVSADGVVKLLDLGLAVFVTVFGRSDERITGPQVLGTQDYMAPEQWTDPAAVTDRADVYGLGCVLYQSLAGSPPFAGAEYAHQAGRKQAHLHQPPADLTVLRPDVPPRLAELLSAMLAKEPAARPAATDVSHRLAEFAAPRGRLPVLVEQARLGRRFEDDPATALATDDPAATRVRAEPPARTPWPSVQDRPPPDEPPSTSTTRPASLLLFILVLAAVGVVLLGGLIFIAAGFGL